MRQALYVKNSLFYPDNTKKLYLEAQTSIFNEIFYCF